MKTYFEYDDQSQISCIQFYHISEMEDIMANPVTVDLPADSDGFLECTSHALYYQKVTIMQSGEEIGIFSGSGENIPMSLLDGSQMIRVGPNNGMVQLTLSFEYSTSGSGGPFFTANVETPLINTNGDFTTITITSEDGVDSDDNDSYLTFSYVLADSYNR